MTKDIVLIHGGLNEGMTARKFWIETGVIEAFIRLGYRVWAPDRVRGPGSWAEEARHLAGEMDRMDSAHLLAASNGCSAAARLAVDAPDRIRSLLFCWPATAGDPQIDGRTRRSIIEAGGTQEAADVLLSGEILRGMAETELSALPIPVGIIAADPPDLYHQRKTVDRLLAIIPSVIELGKFPHPFAPGFQEALPSFCRAVGNFLDR
jgi:pimeloyl-ACP methyl ester carboxylesterase